MSKKTPTRKFDTRKIKFYLSYSTKDLAELLNVDIQTIRSWKRKDGLLPIDDKTKPTLFHGSAIIPFLEEKNARFKMETCAIHEMFCLSCKAPRTPLNKAVHYFPQSRKTANLMSVCSVCNTVMHKTLSLKELPEIQKHLRIEQISHESLQDFKLHPLMTHLSIHGNTRQKFKGKTTDKNGQISFFTAPETLNIKD